MTSSIDGAAFVIGTLAIFGLAVVGSVVVGIASYCGFLVLIEQLKLVKTAQMIVESEEERQKLERLVRNG